MRENGFRTPDCQLRFSAAAEAREPAVYVGPPVPGVLLTLQHEDARTFSHHEPVPPGVEGSRGLTGAGVVLGGQSSAYQTLQNSRALHIRHYNTVELCTSDITIQYSTVQSSAHYITVQYRALHIMYYKKVEV